MYVYDIDGKVAGIIAAEAYRLAKYIYISYIVVDKKYQKNGIATKLFDYIEERAIKKGYYLVELLTKKGNAKMRKFAKKINYKLGGDYVYYYKELK